MLAVAVSPCRPAGRSAASLRRRACLLAAVAGGLIPFAPTHAASLRALRALELRTAAMIEPHADLSVTPAERDRVSASWGFALTGGWFDSSRWSGGVVPNNTLDTQFDATIDTPGVYTVIFNGAAATVSTLTLDNTAATLDLFGGSLTVEETFTLDAGTFRMRAGEVVLGDLVVNAGLFDIDGGVLEVGGVLRSSGGTIRFDAGTIRNTAIDFSQAGLMYAGANEKTFENVTFSAGSLLLGAGQRLRIAGGVSMNSNSEILFNGAGVTVTLEGGQTLNGARVRGDHLAFPLGVLRVEAGDEVVLDANSVIQGQTLVVLGDAGATLRNQGLIRSSLDPSGGHFINEGEVRSSISWATWENHGLVIGGFHDGAWVNTGEVRNPQRLDGQWHNSGLINLAGSYSRLTGNWSSSGVIDAGNGGIVLEGQFTGASLQGLNSESAAIEFRDAVVSNAGNTLALRSNADEWELRNATIVGGGLDIESGANVRWIDTKVDGVAIAGDLHISQHIGNLLVGAGGFRHEDGLLRVSSADIRFQNTAMVEAANIVADGSQFQLSRFTMGGVEVTLGDAVSVTGRAQFIGSSSFADALNNHGVITATPESAGPAPAADMVIGSSVDVFRNHGRLVADPHATIVVNALATSNSGSIEAGQSAIIQIANLVENTGEIFADGGRISFQGALTTDDLGLLRTANSGTIVVGGTIANTGDMWTINEFGDGVRLGGAVTGGVIRVENAASLVIDGSAALDGVAVVSDAIRVASGSLRWTGGTTFTGADVFIDANGGLDAKSIVFDNGHIIDGFAIEVGSGSSIDTIPAARRDGPTLTIGANAEIRGAGVIHSSSIVNDGVIRNAVVSASSFTNNGQVVSASIGGVTQIQNNGLIEMQDTDTRIREFVNAGRLALKNSDISRINAVVASVVNEGVISLDTASRIRDIASLELRPSSVLELVVSSDLIGRPAGFIARAGQVTLDGAISVSVVNPVALKLGDRIDLIDNSAITGQFSQTNFPLFSAGYSFDIVYEPNLVYLLVVIPAPTPAALLTLAGLLAAGRRRR